jgi:hypothetical protein
MGSCDPVAVIPEVAGTPGVETCGVVAAGTAPDWAGAVAVLLVHPATRIAARQTKAIKTRAVLFDMFRNYVIHLNSSFYFNLSLRWSLARSWIPQRPGHEQRIPELFFGFYG